MQGQNMVMTPRQSRDMDELARRLNPMDFTLVGPVQDRTPATLHAAQLAADQAFDALDDDQSGAHEEREWSAAITHVTRHQRLQRRSETRKTVTVDDENSDDELLETIQAAKEYYDRQDQDHAAAVARELKTVTAALPDDPSDPGAAIDRAARILEDRKKTRSEEPAPSDREGISTRAKRMIMGEIDVGQFRYKHTDTMLPRKHQHHMSALLQLFGKGIVVIDVFSGGQRAALGFLAPLSSQNRWVPGDDYVIQTAVEIQSGREKGTVQCEVVARQELIKPGTDRVPQDDWQLGEKRHHKLNEFPRKHLVRMSHVSGGTDAFKLIWRTMVFVFVWEREPRDDLGALIRWVAQL
jgi:hypothetical protein